jgi:hypothetical protein
VAGEREIRDTNNWKERREAAKALGDMGRGGEERNDGGITTSNDGKDDDNNDCKLAAKPTVVDDGGKEGVEETNDVVIKEGCVEAVVDGGRDDNDFEGDDNDLGRDKEETTLTDGAMDTGSDAGANDSSDYNCKPAFKNTVVDNGGNECVDKTCTALNNVVIKEGDAEAVADGGRDNNNFEGGGNDLG